LDELKWVIRNIYEKFGVTDIERAHGLASKAIFEYIMFGTATPPEEIL